MENVGIITFHCSYNYGSALQAYALQTYIESLGFQVKIIDFVMQQDFEQYKLFRTSLYRRQIKSLMADILFFPYHLKRKINFETFSKTKMHLTAKRYFSNEALKQINPEFDIFVCGSDQIWNLDCTHGIEPAYFLDFAEDSKKRIAYAPSLAHTTFEMNQKESLKKLLEKFDAISVREESTAPYLRTITNQKIETTLDPTLLLDQSEYLKLADGNFHKKDYIFVYLLEANKEMIRYCETLKKKTGLPMYYLSAKVNCGFHEGKNLFGISPQLFLSYIYHAKYVVTNSFHATVFSVLFHKQFCTFPTTRSSARMVDLLEKLNLRDRIFSTNFKLDEEIDYTDVESKIRTLRGSSIRFLKSALTIKGNDHEN